MPVFQITRKSDNACSFWQCTRTACRQRLSIGTAVGRLTVSCAVVL